MATHSQLQKLREMGDGYSSEGSVSSVSQSSSKEGDAFPTLATLDSGGKEGERCSHNLADQTNLLPTKQVVVIFLGGSLCLFCSTLDQTILGVALGPIGSYFDAAHKVNWVATAYLLTSAAIMPMHARLSDLIGRKYALILCMSLFWIGSLACAVSQTIEQLIIFRAIAGLGNGGIKTNVQVIVSDVVSLQERGKYQGILAVCTAIANGIGPLLGGVFCQKIGWRWCFWINLPLTGFSIAVIQFFLPFKKVGGDWKTSLRRMDYLGSVIIFTATFCILLALNWGGNKFDWDTAPVLAPLIIGGLLVVAFVLVEQWDRVVKYPIIPMHLFKNRTVAAAYLNSLMSGMIFFGSLFYLPQYLQVVRQYSAIKSGALILALIVTHTAFSFMTGLLASKTSQYVWSIRSGYVSWSVGCGMFTTLAVNTAIPSFIGYSILAGVGAGCTFQISLVAIQASVKRGDMAVATGGRNFLNILGGAISLALCDTILRNTLTTKLSHAGLESDIIDETTKNPTQINTYDDSIRDTLLLSYCGGIRNIYILFTAFAGCMFVLSWLIKQHPLVRDDEAQLKEEGKKFAEEWKNDRKRGIKWRG